MCLFYYRIHLVADPATLISKEGHSWCKATHSDTNCLNNLKGTSIVFLLTILRHKQDRITQAFYIYWWVNSGIEFHGLDQNHITNAYLRNVIV